ncbi:PAS domain S-box protein [Chloroflexota bacterium]
MSEKDSILFVDSDRKICENLATIADFKGYDTDMTTTGKRALAMVKSRWFNIAIVDIKLSDMTGIDLLTQLKEMRSDMEVIIVTGYSSSENALMALKKGAVDYIKKPVDIDELLLVVSQIVAKQKLVFQNRDLIENLQRELTERKHVEDLYQSLTDRSQAGIWIIQKSKFKLINPEFAKITGFSQEELLVSEPLSIIYPDDREKVHESATQMLKGELDSPYEYRIISKDGEIKTVLEAAASIKYEGKLAAMGSCLDVTQRKRDADVIEKFGLAMEQSIDGIAILDGDRNVVYNNKAFAEMHGYDVQEVMGKNATTFINQKHPPEYLNSRKYMKQYEAWRGEVHRTRKDGSVFPALLSITLLRDKGGKATGLLTIIRDITDRKEIEDRLIEVDRLKSEFIANTSHELRTPLQSIMGFAKLLLSGKVRDTERQEEFLKIIERQSEHLVMLINDLIDVQRLESGRFQVEKVDVKINEVITDALSELNAMTVEKSIEISEQYPASLPAVNADALRIKQVIINLVGNAIKFSYDGGKIWVKADIDGDDLLVQVTDYGMGIPKQSVGRIFERFHQVDGSLTRKEQGTGLGLYIVKQIIEAHKGRVWVDSVEGKGSTFSFAIPLT